MKLLSRMRKLIMLSASLLLGRKWLAKRLGVVIGENCRIYIRDFGSEPFLIQLGDNVTITSGVKILTHDGATGLIADDKGKRFQRYSPVKIGNNVFLGVNSIVMPGVSIGDNVIVAAGSIVTKDIPSGSVFGGNPAKSICSFEDYSSKVKAEYISDSQLEGIDNYKERVFHYIKIARQRDEK
ncbi:acyltransferase [Pseudidiomarina sediminum]|uniref:Acyltransferase n=1 Tax=Pseudidiomarina sediminum TaxID=431675 RepID=A0A432Z9B4_9GAMM|nr:acyltransferase [Pseudidiomarina sediminum]RUO74524.1 acyltransferase [Pseudidiomarina sediminum]